MAVISGTAGNDTITPAGVSPGSIVGLPGADADSISGSGGDDLLNGGGGANTVLGGLGNDTIFAGGLGESLDGGDGIDTYVYAGSDWTVVDLLLDFDSKSGVTGTVLNSESAYAGSGNDTLKGTLGDDTLGGGQGNDLIDGRSGFDLVDYGTSYGAAPTMGAIVNLSSDSVTLGGTAYAGFTGARRLGQHRYAAEHRGGDRHRLQRHADRPQQRAEPAGRRGGQ
ncbi:hypothetical protein [Dankookia sp. P2]|uniref:calcium-binding protein n=1 Tax=Dankookia sp. P2 TaxID=3423955 RepID=UPI003D67BAD5